MATMNRAKRRESPTLRRPQSFCLWLGIAVGCLASCGCRDPQSEADNVRLQTQLQQTDERLQVATEQVKAANEQVTASQKLLAIAKAETAAIENRMEEQKKVANEGIRQLIRARDDAQSQLAVANARLEQNQRAPEEKSTPLSPVGIWLMNKLGEDFRLRFYEDGEVRVQKYIDGEWQKNDSIWENPSIPDNRSVELRTRTFLSHRLVWKQNEMNSFSIGWPNPDNGSVNLSSDSEGSIFVTDQPGPRATPGSIPHGSLENWPVDQFGRRVPVPIKKVDASWTPQ
jgi:hypothetical protein